MSPVSSTDGGSGLFGSLTATGSSSGLFGSLTATGSSPLTNTPTNASLFGEPQFSSQIANKPAGTILFTSSSSSSIPQSNTLPQKSFFSAPSSGLGGSASFSSQGAPLLSPTSGSSPHKAASELTPEELEAFKADNFVLGKIPEHAPSSYLC